MVSPFFYPPITGLEKACGRNRHTELPQKLDLNWACYDNYETSVMITPGTFWTRERARYLFYRRIGLASAKSPKHYPLELARAAKLARQTERKRLAAAWAQAQLHLDSAYRLLQSTREE